MNSNGNANNNNCSNTYGARPALMDQPDQVGPERGPKQRPIIIKGGLFPSNAYAWAEDKHIAPTPAAVCAVGYQRR